MFYRDKSVLVTGGSGFVGTALIEQLLEQGARVRVPIHKRPMVIDDPRVELVSADLNDPDDCRRAMDGIQYIFHAAGAVASAAASVAGPMEAIATNLVLTVRVLQAAWEKKVERVLLFSSSTGYPAATHPVKEEEMWLAPPIPVYFGYGWMRRYFEILGEFVSSKSETRVAIVRPTATYGRWDNFHPTRGHVIPALIRRAVARENPFVVWGTGEEIRDFLHVKDLARGSLLLLEKHAVCDPVNIGYGAATSIKDVVGLILKVSDHSKAEVVFDASKPTTIPVRMVDTGKALNLLGFRPEISLEDGLADTVNWFVKNKHHLDTLG